MVCICWTERWCRLGWKNIWQLTLIEEDVSSKEVDSVKKDMKNLILSWQDAQFRNKWSLQKIMPLKWFVCVCMCVYHPSNFKVLFYCWNWVWQRCVVSIFVLYTDRWWLVEVSMTLLFCLECKSEPVFSGGGDARQGRFREGAHRRWKAVAYYAEKPQG